MCNESKSKGAADSVVISVQAGYLPTKALAEMDREYVCVVNLDTKRHPINFNIVSIGDIDQAQIPIQNVFKTAILSNAKSVLALHSHPSESLNPSRLDIEVTKRMVEAGRLIGIPVTDHIIVAGATGLHTSIRSTSPELFSFVAEQSPRFIKDESEKRVSVKQQIVEKQATLVIKKKNEKTVER